MNEKTGQDNAKAFCKYIRDNWDFLAGVAYQYYLDEGRGVMWIDLHKQNQQPVDNTICTFPIEYMPESSGGFEKYGWPVPDIPDYLKQYDPEQQVIILVGFPTGDIKVFFVRIPFGRPPREIYESQLFTVEAEL